MQLIIAEKKELAEDISKAIPGTKNNKGLQIEVGDYVICWVGGHILKLKDPEDIISTYDSIWSDVKVKN